jgi:hypothetical protein
MRDVKDYLPRTGRVVRAALALAAAIALASCDRLTRPIGDPDAGVVVKGVVSAADDGAPVAGAALQVTGFGGPGCIEQETLRQSVTTDAAGRYVAEISALSTDFVGCVEVRVDPGAVVARRFGVSFRERSPRDTVQVDVVLP